MLKIDAQIHIWLTDRPGRPWDPDYRARYRDAPSFLQHAGQSNSAANALEEMAAAGVDGAVLTTLGVYGASNEMELDACRAYPGKFCAVGVADPLAPGLAHSLHEQQSRGLRGIRIPALRSAESWMDPAFHPLLQLCDDLRLTVMLPSVNAALATCLPRYPNAFFFLNHMGTGLAPPIVGYREAQPFARLPEILALARLPNLGLKLTGIPALSCEDFPFRDVWPPVRAALGAFGAERLVWGSDYTRTAGLHSYHDAAHYLAAMDGLAEPDLRAIMGATICERLGWHPDRGAI